MEFKFSYGPIIVFLVAMGVIWFAHYVQVLSLNTSKNSCLIAFFFLLFYYFMKFITYLRDEEDDENRKVPKLLFDEKLAYRNGYNKPTIYYNDTKPSVDSESVNNKPLGWKRYDVKTHSIVCNK